MRRTYECMMKWKEPKVYAARHSDKNVVAASRSGGVFTALCDEVFSKNGTVYGCILTDDFQAVHIRAEETETRNQMRGSKYIQSKLGDIFKQVKQDLNSGRVVLFSGTSCQIAGLRGFLGQEYQNLICVDIVCHGVPSPLVWKKYLQWQEKKHSSKIVSVDFRNKKKFGWRDHVETIRMENGHVVHSRVFARIFYSHNTIRPSCFECPYKSIMHPGDITIADYWGIEKAAPCFDDDKGVSLVLVNNEKGETAFENVKNNLDWQVTKMEDSMQPPLISPFKKPAERKQFWEDFSRMDFEKIARKYGGVGVINKVKDTLSIIKHKVIK